MGFHGGPNRVILGIDPGNNGGMVQLTRWDESHDWSVEHVFKLERGEKEIARFVRTVTEVTLHSVAYLEKVHGWGEGRSFNFGKYYGFVRGVLVALEVPIVDVTPQAWMKEMAVPPQKGQKAAHRQAMRELAGSIQAEVSSTNWNAAAILIAFYGLRQQGGTYRGLHE